MLPGEGRVRALRAGPAQTKREPMRHSIQIRHNFETAHRLHGAGSPVKCMSIHGHSWWVTVTIEGSELDATGMLVEFGAFKRVWRDYLDTNVDHSLVLHEDDPMGAAVRGVYPESRLLLLPESPTTEVIAQFLHARAEECLAQVADASLGLRVSEIHVQETRVNAAGFRPG